MQLAAGTKLDGYEIIGLLGAGGMGEVYRARDPALKREVAIKVLPSNKSLDPDRLSRFQQEAQATAALDHPNILAVHHFGVFEGSPYLVSELLVGESLREVLQRGPIPVRKGIGYAVQIARGLAAAHEKGIVHRDLKPENIFVTKDGHIRILDFGLAKLVQAQADLDTAATTRTLGTNPGVVMGTPGYMSPEQVRGQSADHRTDIFSFGVILYEMLTSRRAFQRSTSAETMAAILNDEPPAISQTGTNIPPALQRLVNRCLEKNPEERFHAASDLAFALEALSDSGSGPVVTGPPSHRPMRRWVMWSIALIAVILLVGVAWMEFASRKNGPPLRISEYSQLTHNGHTGYVLGTDGIRIYLAHIDPFFIDQIAVSGGEIEAVPSIKLPHPFLLDVSPDGSSLLVQSLASLTEGAQPLYAVQAVGGSHRYLADANPASATWSPDAKLVAYTRPNGDLNLVTNDATSAHKLASVGGDALLLSWSPDGRTIRFSRNFSSLWEISSSGSNLRQLFVNWRPSEQKCCGRWSPDGETFVFLAGHLGPNNFPQAQIYALDERRGLFRPHSKDPTQLTSGPIVWSPPFFSKDGKEIFATGSTKRGELVRLDMRSGQFQPFLGGISADLIAFSKDGQSVAYVTYPDGILWRANRDGSDRVQLTSSPFQPGSVSWSPDGTQLVFHTLSPQSPHAWIVRSTGGSPQRLLPEDSGPETDPSWSPDGRNILFSTGEIGSHDSHISSLDLASHQIHTLPGSDGKFMPRCSPDGRFVYASSIDTFTIYIFDLKTQHWSALATGPHAYARWSTDSRSIYFLRYATDPAILRIPATGGEAKLVVSLKNFPYTGTNYLWFGLDPTDAPLMLRDVSTTDVYALTLSQK
jgi:serine/threonine protein kinase